MTLNISNEALVKVVKDCKSGLLEALSAPGLLTATRPAEVKQWVHPVERMHVDLMILEALEKEIKARGLDPSHEVFGVDVLGEVAAIKAEVLRENA